MFKVSNEAKVGALTAISITILLLGYNFLKGNDLFSTSNNFHAIYDNVDGLSKSNAVVINGFKVGQVVSVEMLPDKRLYVTFEVNSGVKLSKFDTSRIMANDLFNTKVLNLTDCGIEPLAKEDDTLIAYLQPGLAKMIGDALSPLKAKVENLLSVIDSTAKGLKSAVGNGTSSEISNSIQDIRQTLANLKNMSASLNNLVGEEKSKFNQILANVASITKNLKDNNEVLSKTLKNVKNITDSLAASDLKNTISQTKATMASLNDIVMKINKGEGSLGLLVNDKKMYDNLQSSAASLDKLLIDLKANPKRYLHFSVFGGKKEKKK